MYNEQFNNDCIDKFRTHLSGKRVLLLGNALSLFSSEKHGELIDSYDFVLRFGKGIPTSDNARYVGKRFDGWFFGSGRAGQFRNLPYVPWKIFTPSQVRMYDNVDMFASNREMYDGRLQVYRDFFISATPQEILSLNKLVNQDQHKKSRCSQGLQALEFFNKKVGVPVTLFGFDFFGGVFTYNFDNTHHPHIPAVQPTTSWHCPLVSAEYIGNPHAYSLDGKISNEEKYMRSLDGVTIIDMPPVDPEKAAAQALKLRGLN